jgi:ribosomal protein S18 acetylase RimI-like enzyme
MTRIVAELRTPHGDEIVIRYPAAEDCEAMWEYINALSAERTFLTVQGEAVSLDDERAYVQRQLERIERREEVQLGVWCGGKLAGLSNVGLKANVSAHVGVFGIAIARPFRGRGIGSLLMRAIWDEAKKELPQLRVVTLEGFGNNPLAKAMYEKFGFVEYGRLPEGVVHRGQYVDSVWMYRNVR